MKEKITPYEGKERGKNPNFFRNFQNSRINQKMSFEGILVKGKFGTPFKGKLGKRGTDIQYAEFEVGGAFIEGEIFYRRGKSF